MQDVTEQVSLPSVHCMWDIPLLLDSSLYFISHTMFQLIFSSLLEHQISNIPGISDLISEVFNFQHHTKLCSNCSSLLVCSLNWSPICWWKQPFSCWMLLFHGNPGYNFMRTPYIIYYHITQIAEILKIFQLCSYIIICIRDGCLEILITFVSSTFISIPQHLPT